VQSLNPFGYFFNTICMVFFAGDTFSPEKRRRGVSRPTVQGFVEPFQSRFRAAHPVSNPGSYLAYPQIVRTLSAQLLKKKQKENADASTKSPSGAKRTLYES
jgi:hypothetical protein